MKINHGLFQKAFPALKISLVVVTLHASQKAERVLDFPAHESFRAIQKAEILGQNSPFLPKSISVTNLQMQNYIESQFKKYLPKRFKPRSASITDTLVKEAEKYQMDPLFLLSVIKVESHFNPLTRGRHKELGLMQIKPDTGEWIAQKMNLQWQGAKALRDPEFNIVIGAAYFSYLRSKFKQNAAFYMSAYNVGENRMRKLRSQGKTPTSYTRKITAKYSENYQQLLSLNTRQVASN
jgi:soluble lytic murein transglycosylase